MTQEEIYRSIVDFLPLPALIHQDMKVVYLNDEAAKVAGVERKEELIGVSVLSVMPKDFVKVAEERIKLMLETGKRSAPLIERVVGKNNKIIEVEITANPIIYNGKPAILLVAQDRTPIKVAYEEVKKRNLELEKIKKANLNIIEDLAIEINKKREIEKKLKASEEKFRTIFESSPDVLFILDDKFIVDCNKAAEKVFGSNREGIIGKSPLDFSPEFQPDGKLSYTKVVNYVKQAYQGRSLLFEWRHRRVNGKEFDAEVRLSKFRLGKEKYLVAIIRDISERKKIAQKLEENERRFRTLASATSTSILIYQGDKFIYGNRAVLKLTGYSLEEFVKLRFWDVVHPDFKDLVRERGLARQRGERVPNRYEFKIVTKTGKEKWLDFTAGEIIWDGKPAGIGTATDITARKIAEKYLQESEERFRSLAELLPVAIFEADLDLKITYANKKAFELYKLPLKLKKKGIEGLKLIAPHERERLLENLEKYSLSGFQNISEYVAVRKDGVHFPIKVRTAPIFDEEKIVGIRGVIEDITSQKRSETILKIQYEIANAVLTARNLDELFEVVQAELNQLVDVSHFYFAEFDEKENKFVLRFASDVNNVPKEWQANTSLSGYLLKKGKSLLMEGERIKELINAGKLSKIKRIPKQWLGALVKSKQKILGTIVIQNFRSAKSFDRYSVEIMEIIARQISSYIEQKKVEEELLKIMRAVEKSPSAIFITDDRWRIQYANPKLAEISGYSREELIGQKTKIFASGMHSDSYYDFMKESVAKGSDWSGEFINRKKNGELYWVRTSVSPLINEKGHIVNYVVVQEDFTERKEIEEKLANSEAQFRSVWENSYDAMRLMDFDGNIIDVNTAFCNLVGMKREDLINQKFFIVYRNFDVENELKELKRRYSGKTRFTKFEAQVELWNGKKYWWELSNSVLTFQDKKPILLSIIRDISQRKEMIRATIEAKEKAEEMNRLKTQFFLYMSHELRTPFMGIMGYAQLLRDEIEDPTLKKMTVGILNTSKRMLTTLNNILDVTKLEFDESEKVYAEINLGEVILNVYDEFTQSAEEKNIKLIKKLPKEEMYVHTDKRVIYGIFNNLVDNAIKFTDQGFVEIALRKKRKGKEKKAVVEIRDSGIGIPPEKQELIWDEFRQASEGTSRAYQGSGLGLTVVKKFVEMLNGSISLNSEIGRGTTFTIEFPIM